MRHSLEEKQGAEWGMRRGRGGRGDYKHWLKNSIPSVILTWMHSKGGGAKITLFLRFFFEEPIFAEGMKLKINFFVFFFSVKEHLVPGINHFRK